MCYRYALGRTPAQVADTLQPGKKLGLAADLDAAPRAHVHGFDFPRMPVVAQQTPDLLTVAHWGLVPAWVTSATQAQQLRAQTLNARAETLHEKPSFRHLIHRSRCIVPADGLYEWLEHQGKKYPFFVCYPDRRLFAFAGLTDTWQQPGGDVLHTFTIVTTRANALLSAIHHTQKRMPVILSPAQQACWLDPSAGPAALNWCTEPLPDDALTAWPVSKALAGQADAPPPDAPVRYPGLRGWMKAHGL